jgi:hypothetical protein
MGLSMEFYAGDAEAIGRAFSEVEWDGLRDGSDAAAYADLSLHLAPDDLDALSEAAADLAGIAPSLLSCCLIEQVGALDGGQTGSADLVDPRWPEMFIDLGDEGAEQLTSRWFSRSRLGRKYGRPLEVNRGAVAAVAALIRLCRKAVAGGHDIVYAWYL